MNVFLLRIVAFQSASKIFVFGLMLALSSCANITTQDFSHENSDLPVSKNLIFGKLDNGLRYIIMHNQHPPNTLSIRMHVNTGSLNESEGTQGLAHFLEHMAFNGSKNILEGEMVKRLERNGLSFGADTNAYTSFDETVYMLDLPRTDEDILNESLFIMRETAQNLTLETAAIERERGVVQSEKRRQDSPSARAYWAGFTFFTKGTRLEKRLPIGTNESLKTVSKQHFTDYYQNYYHPENIHIVMIGDVAPNKAIQSIKKHFADWRPRGQKAPPLEAGTRPPPTPNNVDKTIEIGYFSAPNIQANLILASHNPYQEKPDTLENRREAFIHSLGTKMLNRRLQSLAQDSNSPFVSAYVGEEYTRKTARIHSLTITPQLNQWQNALMHAENALRQALQYGFSPAELSEQIANIRTTLQIAVESASTRHNNDLASQIVNTLIAEYVITSPQENLELFNTFTNELDLTMVESAFKENWQNIDSPMIYMQTPKALTNPFEDITTAYKRAKTNPVTIRTQNETPDFAYTQFPQAGTIKTKRHIEDIDTYLYEFENGVRLNAKKTDFEANTIKVQIRFGGGSLSIPQKSAALSIMANQIVNMGGLGAHSHDELLSVLAGKAVGTNFRIDNNSFVLLGQTTPADLRLQLSLMHAYLTDPGYRAEAKTLFEKNIRAWYPSLATTPSGVAARDITRIIRNEDMRFGIPDIETLLAPKIKDVRDWLAPYFENAPLEISVVGDFDPEALRTQIAVIFASLPKRTYAPKNKKSLQHLAFPAYTPNPRILNHEGDQNRALLQMYWPSFDGRDIEKTRRLNVLNRIFKNRLIDVVREELGGAYSPSSQSFNSRFYPNYGYMMVTIALEPKTLERVTNRVLEITQSLRQGDISEDEFTRAIQPILEKLDTDIQKNNYWQYVIASAQSDDWDIRNSRTRAKSYQDMELSALKPLAKQVFSNKPHIFHVLPAASPKLKKTKTNHN